VTTGSAPLGGPSAEPIGVYDSGFGGLTVLRALRAALPHQDFVYLGDAGRAPYGGRDVDTILDFAEQCVERLFGEGCRLVVVACHTVSCVALRHLQLRYAAGGGDRRILGVTIPAAEAATARSAGRIGVVATARTVASHTWITEIAKLGPHEVVQVAAPLLAPIVEAMFTEAKSHSFCIATDATSAPVRVKGQRECARHHVFVFIADQRHVLFRHAPDHTGQTVRTWLSGYSGYLLADAASIYDVIFREEPIIEVACWAHMRRYST
jgi:glutamate racemase